MQTSSEVLASAGWRLNEIRPQSGGVLVDAAEAVRNKRSILPPRVRFENHHRD
jgi:hypothetical protein